MLLGWALDVAALKHVLPGVVSMKANTAVGSLLTAASLALLLRGDRWARAPAVALLTLGLATMLEWFAGVSFGIDEVLVTDEPSPVFTAVPGRMSLLTALAFSLMGGAILLRTTVTPRYVSDGLALLAAGVGGLSVIGYAYGTSLFAYVPGFTTVAIHTGVVFLLAGTALAAHDVERGVLARWAMPTPGGQMLRRVVPVSVFALLAIAGTHLWLVRIGATDDATATTVGVIVFVAILVAAVGTLATHNDRVDAERVRAEAALRARSASLEAANKELEDFAYTVSHDLRTPLRAMDGFASIVQSEHAADLSPPVRRYLGLVREATAEMGSLVDELLDLWRLGRRGPLREAVAPARIAAEVGAELQKAVAPRVVEMSVAPMPECRADPVLLRTLYACLLDNAFKFTRPRDPARVEVGFDTAQGAYFVKDNGVGFDMRHAGRIFEMFERLHGLDEFEGHGIGLATVHRIVKAHGGRVWVDASPDRGATFYFTIPEARPVAHPSAP